MTQHIKKALLFGAASCLAVFSASGAGTSDAGKPNILWIVTEDIGCDMACYGTKGVHTPHMDQLASEGAAFLQAV
jgi:hypothetical protein